MVSNYADNMVLIPETEYDLQYFLTAVNEWA